MTVKSTLHPNSLLHLFYVGTVFMVLKETLISYPTQTNPVVWSDLKTDLGNPIKEKNTFCFNVTWDSSFQKILVLITSLIFSVLSQL